MQANFKKNITISLIFSSLVLSLSMNCYALDFKKIKEAIKQNQSSSDVKPADNSSSPTTSESVGQTTTTDNQTTEKTISNINWKKPTVAEEIELGREITGNILGAAPLVKDEGLQKYVNTVGRWVASQSERADLPWHFGVIESDDFNAFSAPGGYVLITKGLYRKLDNEAQLAGVLGHEIAHVVKKHQLKVIQKQELLNLGANFLSSKLGKNNRTAQKVIGSGAEISARKLDKDAEFEADNIGMVLATRAGYEPFGLAEVLQTLGQTNPADNKVALLFKTHPSPDERLIKLSDAVGTSLDKVQAGKTLENRLYKIN